MSRVLSLHGKQNKPRRTPEEEKMFQETLDALKNADQYVIIQPDPKNPNGPLMMQHNLHPAELNLLLDQLKLINLDSLLYEED